jgi:hypothetical protein
LSPNSARTNIRLALKKKPIYEALAKEKQIREGKELGGNPTLSQNSDEGFRTDEAIASDARVSRDTVARVAYIENRLGGLEGGKTNVGNRVNRVFKTFFYVCPALADPTSRARGI